MKISSELYLIEVDWKTSLASETKMGDFTCLGTGTYIWRELGLQSNTCSISCLTLSCTQKAPEERSHMLSNLKRIDIEH